MTYPKWLGTLGKKEEQQRASKGVMPRSDGWYKTVNMKKRYIAKPMPLADLLELLPARLDEINGVTKEKPSTLAVNATSIEALAEMYLAHLWQRHTTGSPRKLSRRTYDDYMKVLFRFCELVGPQRAAIAVEPSWFTRYMRTLAGKAETTKQREIIYLTAFFNWAGPGRHSLNFYKEPVQFGPDFRKPDQGKLRTARQGYSTLYSADQTNAALDAVSPSPMLYAMGLLALNCAFIPEDLATVPLSAIDFDAGLVVFPRSKTGIPRKAVLMPETIAALKRYLLDRPTGMQVDPALFVRDDGKSFNQRDSNDAGTASSHGNTLSIYWGRATGLPLKGLRTTFRTCAAGAVDKAATDLVMGHGSQSVGDEFYVKHFAPERLKTVIDLVWQLVGPRKSLPDAAWCPASTLARLLSAQRAAPATPTALAERSGIAAA